MNRFLKKIFLTASASILFFVITMQKANGQTLHDSLRNLLVYFQENTKDEKLRQLISKTLPLYTGNSINDSLSEKLLDIEDLLVEAKPNKSILSYAMIVKRIFQELPPNNESSAYAHSLANLAVIYQNISQYEKALPLFEEELAIKKTIGKESPGYANSLNNLAALYDDMGQYDKALPLFQEVIAIRKKIVGEEHPDYATSLNDLAILYRHMGQYDKALPLYQQTIAIRKKVLGEEHSDYASSLNNLAVLYESMGQYEKALPLYDQVLLIQKKVLGEEHTNYLQSLYNKAFVFSSLGQYDKALPLYEQVLAVRKKNLGEENPQYVNSLNSLAYVHYRRGEFYKAMPLLEQALSITKKVLGEEHPAYANSLHALATFYSAMGNYERALPLYQKALAIRKKVLGEQHPDCATSLTNLADLYRNTGEYNKAIPLLEEALAIRKKTLGEEHFNYAISLNSLALVYERMGQYDKALPLYNQASSITKKAIGEESADYANNLNNLASLYTNMGLYDTSLALHRKILAIRKNALGTEHPEYANSLYGIGLIDMMQNNTEGTALLTEADNLILRHIKKTYSTLSEQEKIAFLTKMSSQFSYVPSMIFTKEEVQPSLTRQAYTNELALKGMVLENQQSILSSIRNKRDSIALQLYNDWRLNKAILGKQMLLSITKRIPHLDSLDNSTNSLEQQLSRQSMAFRNQMKNQKIDIKNITEKLRRGQAAVEFIRFPYYNKKWTDSILYAALILLPGDSIPHFIPLCEEKQLQRLLNLSINAEPTYALQKIYPGEKSHRHDSLYQLIWKPLEKFFSGIHTIYFAPAGLLHRVAFNALKDNTSHLLIDKYALQQVLSTRSVATPVTLSPKLLTASVWGNIQYTVSTDAIALRDNTTKPQTTEDNTSSSFNFYTSDTRASRGGEWTSLPQTKKEIEALKKTFKEKNISTTIISDTVATEEAFKAFDGRSPQVLHLATHGFFLPVADNKNREANATNTFTVQQNPMFRSGLVLAGGNNAWKGEPTIEGKEDGILTAYEIAQLDLSNTDLVVLSACETALGDLQGNEGVIGLQRALKLAGVKQMIVSLWRVPDKETVELMTLFYHNWLGGQTTREALRKAQLKMKEKYSPFYWAAFVLIE